MRDSIINDLRWPFEAIVDRHGRAGVWVVLHGPIVTAPQQAQFAELRRAGSRFIGMTSYLDFPRTDMRDGLDYGAVCEAWCHCFHEPHRFFRHDAPRALISASDFTDGFWIERVTRERRAPVLAPNGEALAVVYIGASEPWQQPVKNWPLAARCLPRLWREAGLRSLVIGLPDEVFPDQQGIDFAASLDWPVLLATIASARFLFAPNTTDPSPRVVAEALCLGVPVLMHGRILGGWKYVTRYTGAFFDDESDVLGAAASLVEPGVSSREWFRANFGPEASSRRLAALLRAVDPAVDVERGWRVTPAGPSHRRAA